MKSRGSRLSNEVRRKKERERRGGEGGKRGIETGEEEGLKAVCEGKGKGGDRARKRRTISGIQSKLGTGRPGNAGWDDVVVDDGDDDDGWLLQALQEDRSTNDNRFNVTPLCRLATGS